MPKFTPSTLAAVLAPVADDPAADMRQRMARVIVAAFDRCERVSSPAEYEALAVRIARAWHERNYGKLSRVLRHVGAA